jgi:hypothetical protein
MRRNSNTYHTYRGSASTCGNLSSLRSRASTNAGPDAPAPPTPATRHRETADDSTGHRVAISRQADTQIRIVSKMEDGRVCQFEDNEYVDTAEVSRFPDDMNYITPDADDMNDYETPYAIHMCRKGR